MASTINASTAGGGGIISSADSSGVLQLQTAGTTAVTVDASQNVGIGVTPNTSKVYILTAGTAVNALEIYSPSTTNGAKISLSDDNYGSYIQTSPSAGSTSLVFGNTGTERMRIDASGNVLVGTTSSFGQGKVCVQSSTGLSLKGTSTNNAGEIELVRNDTNARAWVITANGSDLYIANAGFTKYAQLTSQNFTSWTFASDKRIKNNIEDLSYGLAEVLKIKPRQFNYISDNQHDIGFIAQELQSVIPEAVSGTEILYEDTDTPQEKASKTMGVSKDALIPVLVKAIQELKAIVDTQAEQIKALQGASV